MSIPPFTQESLEYLAVTDMGVPQLGLTSLTARIRRADGAFWDWSASAFRVLAEVVILDGPLLELDPVGAPGWYGILFAGSSPCRATVTFRLGTAIAATDELEIVAVPLGVTRTLSPAPPTAASPQRKYTVMKGARDPYALRVVIDATGIAAADRVIADLTTVSAVELRVVDRHTGATETWTTGYVSAEADVLLVDRLYQATDTDELRTWHVVPWLTVIGADNPVPIRGFDLQVIEP